MSSSRCHARHDPTDGRVARKLPVAASLLVGRKIARKATFNVHFYHRSRQGAEDDKTIVLFCVLCRVLTFAQPAEQSRRRFSVIREKSPKGWRPVLSVGERSRRELANRGSCRRC